MHLSARGSNFGLFLQCKLRSIFHCCKTIFGYKKNFMIFFGTSVFLK